MHGVYELIVAELHLWVYHLNLKAWSAAYRFNRHVSFAKLNN